MCNTLCVSQSDLVIGTQGHHQFSPEKVNSTRPCLLMSCISKDLQYVVILHCSRGLLTNEKYWYISVKTNVSLSFIGRAKSHRMFYHYMGRRRYLDFWLNYLIFIIAWRELMASLWHHRRHWHWLHQSKTLAAGSSPKTICHPEKLM